MPKLFRHANPSRFLESARKSLIPSKHNTSNQQHEIVNQVEPIERKPKVLEEGCPPIKNNIEQQLTENEDKLSESDVDVSSRTLTQQQQPQDQPKQISSIKFPSVSSDESESNLILLPIDGSMMGSSSTSKRSRMSLIYEAQKEIRNDLSISINPCIYLIFGYIGISIFIYSIAFQRWSIVER